MCSPFSGNTTLYSPFYPTRDGSRYADPHVAVYIKREFLFDISVMDQPLTISIFNKRGCMEKLVVHMEIALAISEVQISIAAAGGSSRFTLHMSAVAASAFNHDVQFALRPRRFRFSASRHYFPMPGYHGCAVRSVIRWRKATGKLRESFHTISQRSNRELRLCRLQITDWKSFRRSI